MESVSGSVSAVAYEGVEQGPPAVDPPIRSLGRRPDFFGHLIQSVSARPTPRPGRRTSVRGGRISGPVATTCGCQPRPTP